MLTPAMYFHPCSSEGLWPGVFQLSIFIKLACGAEPCLPIMGVMEIERPWRATRPTSQKHNENHLVDTDGLVLVGEVTCEQVQGGSGGVNLHCALKIT